MTTQSRVFERICVFCEKAKYLKGTKTREALIQSVDLHVDLPSGERLWVKTIQGYWLLSLGNFLQQKRVTISLVIMIRLETFKELLAVVITRKRKMSVLNIPMQNHKPKRTPSEMKDQKVNTGIFKPITRLNSGENSCVAQRTNKHS